MFQRPRLWAFRWIPALAVVACTQSVQTNDAGEQMVAALSDAGQENNRHASACNAASSMTDMMTELTRHESTMSGIMQRMDDARDEMRMGSMMSRHCSGSSFDGMCTDLSELHGDMASHAERMRSAVSLDAARSECAAHTDSMRTMMQSMHDDLDEMPCMQP